ncbi:MULTISPECIES: BCCT family transporter [Pseudomonas syringae group]|uniref:BCCT family transporter n=1 Tax=Pseudomonas syringae group TaxID=136849 RepID=UPI000290ED81|nr:MULTISPECIES: BCCT family transporter [Pseudomonas syringae group]MCF9016864.1 BCCT family transporter [Pseudomonas syringae]EKN46042.1 choline/carnitine/betaine transporter [Pseudomonas viridiflava UASWS0038]MEE3915114.1 BCCT family transporter [Pseudomonas viridiflava]MEE3972864.1 BCCT family transporter [Pseudomonas viridiflava]MEE4018104.1 BCCT family transporter [Pseudomonas viridiflava]
MDKKPENDVPEQTQNANIEGIPAPSGDANLIDTDYVIGQDNIKGQFSFSLDIHGKVFIISAATVVLFVVLTLALQAEVEPLFNAIRNWLTGHLAWLFMSVANVFVVLCLALIVSPLGKVRIGGREAKPDYTYVGWFSMLFAAGMGIGLMFYGVAEPMSHYSAAMGGVSVDAAGVRTDWAPLGGAQGDMKASADLAMAATIFHWGLHPWAIYAIVALSLALFSYNKGLPLSIRSIFYPLLGERVWGWPGHIIDILAVFATLFGLATSLGIGAEQAAAGIEYLFGIKSSNLSKVVLIVGITLIALWSVLAGLDKGVKLLSQINMGLALLLLVFIIVVGPTVAIFTGFFHNLVNYVEYLPALSNPFGRTDTEFTQGWTAFYWAWWISWSPFVGMFIARVSRGRTVREFLISVLLVPTLVSVLWMTTFGGTAIDQATLQGVVSVKDAVLELKLFAMLGELPLKEITSFLGIVLVIVFFITSSDSGSLVIDTITAGGKVNAPVPQRVFWAVIEGVIAIALLLGGGLVALQAMAVSTGLPFAIVLMLGCISLVKGLLSEPRS